MDSICDVQFTFHNLNQVVSGGSPHFWPRGKALWSFNSCSTQAFLGFSQSPTLPPLAWGFQEYGAELIDGHLLVHCRSVSTLPHGEYENMCEENCIELHTADQIRHKVTEMLGHTHPASSRLDVFFLVFLVLLTSLCRTEWDPSSMC